MLRLWVGLRSVGVSSTSVTVIGSTTSGIVGISSTGISGYITACLIVGRLICCSSSSICIRGNGIFIICMIAIIYGSSGSNCLFILCFCFFCFGIYNYFAGCLCTTCLSVVISTSLVVASSGSITRSRVKEFSGCTVFSSTVKAISVTGT